jgi:hypothetical protein
MFKSKGWGVEMPTLMDISCFLSFLLQIIFGGYMFFRGQGGGGMKKTSSSDFAHITHLVWIFLSSPNIIETPLNQLDAQCDHCGQCASWNQCPKVRICYKSKTFDIYFHSIPCWRIFVCEPIALEFYSHACICSNIWPGAKVFLCLWHVYKAWADNVIKMTASMEERSKVLSTFGNRIYSQKCPLHAEPILWA